MYSITPARLFVTLLLFLLASVVAYDADAQPAPSADVWTGALDTGGGTLRLELRVTGDGEDRRAELISVDQGGARLPIDAYSIEDGAKTFAIDQIGARFRGTMSEGGTVAEGTWTQGGTELPLTLKRDEETSAVTEQEIFQETLKEAWVGTLDAGGMELVVQARRVETTDVTFENTEDEVTLAGTLTLPEGPGPQDRDETLMEHKPFLVLADYLSRRGIPVLRYDDRGFGASTGAFAGATSEDVARDASAALDYLRTHSAIDPARIGLIGHSEGGLVAPMVAAERNDVAFIIEVQDRMVAAAFDAAVRSETPEAVGPAVQQAVDEVVAASPEEQRAVADEVREELRMGREQLATPWVRFFLSYDPYPTLARVSAPVLALTGDRDVQVLADVNVPRIEQALEEAGHDASAVVVLEGLNHLFQQSETGAMSEYATIDETINPRALDAVGDWITARVATPHE